ncbi:MAG: peptide deformylase [Deltaproteobacteria bacterium]|nr:peptide deformylase [Deltaproteobacteria bacterium]
MRKRIALGSILPSVLLALGGCASDDDFPDSHDALPEPGADVVEDVPVESPETEAADVPFDADGADDAVDEGSTGCPPLTIEEIDLILAEAADRPMAIVTNDNLEGDVFLHGYSLCVDLLDPTIWHLVSRMRRTLARSFGGVGLAAPQVGVHRRILLAQRTDQVGRPIQAFLNPWIVDYSAETTTMTEGCLSVPGESPSVERSLEVSIDYDMEDGTPVTGERVGGAAGSQAAYAARIVQHEHDHLEGILIVDPR